MGPASCRQCSGTGWPKPTCLPRLHPSTGVCVPVRCIQSKGARCEESGLLPSVAQRMLLRCISSVRRPGGGTGRVPRFGCHRLSLLQNSAGLGARGVPGGDATTWSRRWRSPEGENWAGSKHPSIEPSPAGGGCEAGAEDSEVWESVGGMGGRACKYCHSASQTLLPVPDVALPPPSSPLRWFQLHPAA